MKRHSILLSSIAFACSAWAASPGINTITPAAGQRGTEVEVQLNGGSLEDARTLLFNDPGIEVLAVSEPDKGKFKAKLKIAADARLGEYNFRGITNSGIADLRLFYVTPYPVQAEAEEDKKEPYKPQTVALGVTIHGSTPGEDQDHFEVEMKKGQRLTAEVVGVRLSTQQQYDPFIKITKADGTTELAEQDDSSFTRQDPAVSIIVPEDGKYRVILKAANNSGQGPCNYVLHIGGHPRPVVAYPGGGKGGSELKVQLLGDAAGPFEQAVKLPDAPDSRFDLTAQKDGLSAPQPNFLRVSHFDNVLEAEPNNEPAKATPAPGPLPLAFNGIIQEPGDVDFFKFTAKKDEEFDFRVFARALRSPLDAVLGITKIDGAGLAGNDDSGGPDSYQRWKSPADGEYCLTVQDQLRRGGPLFTYRVEAHKIQPKIEAYLPEVVQNSSQQRRAIPVPKGNRYATLVRVKKSDAGGDILVEPHGLPGGVTAATDTMDKSVDTVPMVFTATPDAAPSQKTMQILPKLADAAANANVALRVLHRVEVTENGNQRSYYGVDESTLAIAVVNEVPVTLELAQPKVPLLRDGQKTLKITATRKAGPDGKPLFNGAIPMQVLYGPPGVGLPGTVNIAEGKAEGDLIISANGNAPVDTWKICVVGTVNTGTGEAWISTGLVDLEIAEPFVVGTIKRTFVDQASEGEITVALEQKVPFDGKAKLKLEGLPAGVTAEDREFTKDDKQVKFTLKATDAAQVGQHKTLIATFSLEKNGEIITNTIARGGILRVDKNTGAPKVADAKQ